MIQKEIDIIKKSIEELKLDENYYEDLRRNCKKLWDKRISEYNYQFYEDGSYYDIYNPDAYNVNLYIIHDNDKFYLGNEQIPIETCIDNKKRTVNIIEYWFRGNNSNYVTLHEFIGIHNKSIKYYGCGCNQSLLNLIKQKIIGVIKTNLNINDIGEIETSLMQKQYGKIISKYKANTRKLLKKTSIEDFSNKILTILDDIEKNTDNWLKILYEKNRYWFISENKQDRDDVRDFLVKYSSCRENDYLYLAVLIIFKEYLLWQTCELYSGYYWKTIFSKKSFISSPKCTVNKLFDWKKLWDNSKPIELILSICYKNIHEWKVTKDKSDYKRFRNKLYKNINSKEQ